METWPVIVFPVEGRYWTRNEAVPFGERVRGNAGTLASVMADVPVREAAVRIAELAPVYRTVTVPTTVCPMPLAVTGGSAVRRHRNL
jgi:hypothetical protein